MPKVRSADTISAAKIEADLARYGDENVYVYNTGVSSYRKRSNSLRSAALGTITEIRIPVPLNEFLRRAATAGKAKGTGYDIGVSKGGLFLHQVAKPATYFALVLKGDGDSRGYYTYRSIPDPSGDFAAGPGGIAADVRILDAKGRPVAVARPKASSRPAPADRAPALAVAGSKPSPKASKKTAAKKR